MTKSYKLDESRVIELKERGIGNSIIAHRLGVTPGAIYHCLKRLNRYQDKKIDNVPLGRYIVNFDRWEKFLHKYKPDF